MSALQRIPLAAGVAARASNFCGSLLGFAMGAAEFVVLGRNTATSGIGAFFLIYHRLLLEKIGIQEWDAETGSCRIPANPMNYTHLVLAAIGATVAYFAFGFALFAALPGMKREFLKYPGVYRSEKEMMKVMPFGMLAILASIVVVAIVYAKMYPAGGGIAAGACLGVLIGIFAICTFVIHNYCEPEYRHCTDDLPRDHILHSVGHRWCDGRVNLQVMPMTDEELQLLTWRYAAMIGIIKPDERYSTAEQVAADRAKWPQLVLMSPNGPLFDFDRAAVWMAQVSGETPEHTPEDNAGGLSENGITEQTYYRWRKELSLPVASG